MLLSDQTTLALMAAGDIKIVPEPHTSQIQPVSVDLRLGSSFCRLHEGREYKFITDKAILRPSEFLLACTMERIVLADHVAGFVCGKSTLARRGLMVEAAGLVDPGFDGTITLELKNLSDLPLPLSAGMLVCQIAFHATDKAVLRPYGTPGLNSHYQGQTRAEPAHE